MFKKLLAIMVSFIFIFIVGCNNEISLQTLETKSDKVIKIACASPLKGELREVGKSVNQGAKMALEKRKNSFAKKGFKLVFVPADDSDNPVKVAEELVNDTQILGIVGHLTSGATLPASIIYDKANLAMVSPSATVDEITQRGLDNTNRIVPKDSDQATVAASYAFNELNAKTAAILCENDVDSTGNSEYSGGLSIKFQKAFSTLGGKVVSYELVKTKQTKFPKVIEEIKKFNPDIIYYGGYPTTGSSVLNELRNNNLSNTFFGPDAFDSDKIVSLSKNNVQDVYYTATVPDPTLNKEGKNWADTYKSIYDEKPANYGAYGYDCMNVLLNATLAAIEINDGGLPLREQVCTTLRKTNKFPGVSTSVTFNYYGDNVDAAIYIFQFKKEEYPGNFIKKLPVLQLDK